jgi:hypothetical protein
MTTKHSFIEGMLKESRAYLSLDQILGELEKGQDLSSYPIEPIFVLLKDLDFADRSLVLTKLSSEQRQTVFDLAVWNKDQIDVEEAAEWLVCYAHSTNEEMRFEFVQSGSFLTFLKGRFNIWTFDVEDPEYPDHDYYFLTDDSLLLFEYDEQFMPVGELKALVGDLYSALGPEKAYQLLFQYVSESYSLLEEEEYQKRRSRLQDQGFIDYFDALPLVTPFPTQALLEKFIKGREGKTGQLESEQLKQNLHHHSLACFSSGLDPINQELEAIDDEKRLQFLKFDFIRTVNSKLSVEDALRAGRMRTDQIVGEVKLNLLLGHDWLSANGIKNIFNTFLFSEIYKIGVSLVSIERSKVKKALSQSAVGEHESFLGVYWSRFLELLFQTESKVQADYYDAREKTKDISSRQNLELLQFQAKLFCDLLPFIGSFYKTFEKLCADEFLQDDYYLNYTLADIDFEAILLSSVLNFQLTDLNNAQKKMGITTNELVALMKLKKSPQELFYPFAKQYGLDGVKGLEEYFNHLYDEYLSGYNFEEMNQGEFKHVGGPIILKSH